MTRAFLRRSRTQPIAMAAAVVASGLVLGGLAVAHSAQIEADTRATLLAELDRAQADLDAVAERTVTAQSLAAQGQSCIEAEVAKLRPAIGAPARFSPAVVAVSTAVTNRAVVAAGVGTETSVALVSTAADAGVDELRTALAELHQLRLAQGDEATRAVLVARERAAACEAARSAVASTVADVAARTDAVIAANGLASPESVAELRAAGAAVQAADGTVAGGGAEALPRWIAAATAVEAAHTAAAAAMAAEEAAAAVAASERDSSGEGPRFTGPPAPLPWFAGRRLTPEEVAALGMPPGTILYEDAPGAISPSGPPGSAGG